VIDDDVELCGLLGEFLSVEGFDVECAHDGKQGLEIAFASNPDLVILDVMLPGIDGFEVLRRFRQKRGTPVLMLTAREEELDRVLGFTLGADDYVVKPFSPRELVERVKAILRRSCNRTTRSDAPIHLGGIVLDPERHSVTLDGRPVSLTPSEYCLLYALMTAPGRVFTRDELLAQLYDHGGVVIDRVIDVHIGKIRQKLEPDPSSPYYIQTLRGVGYRFAEHAR